MTFTPVFADLTRNFTMVEGTGPALLGAAASGHSGIAEMLNPGDRFFYSLQSLSDPAEREVGRGTLLADGAVAREPSDGAAPVDFGAGAKTITLVAAAEWFRKVEAGAAGGSGALPSLAALAALEPAAGDSATLGMAGRAGLFVFAAGDHSALVAADTRQGIYVAPASDPGGASGAWVRQFDGPVNVRWFGAAADFITDDLPAFDAALATIVARNSGYSGNDSLFIPAGNYFLGDAWNIHAPVVIQGSGSGQTSGTLIRFPANSNGIVFNYWNTHDDGLGQQGNADGSSLSGVQLWGGNMLVDDEGEVASFWGGDSPNGHGIRIRTPFVAVKDVLVAFFGGDGININASSGSGGSTEGNANSFHLERCQSIYNRGFGFLTNGLDANAGAVIACSAISNGGGGFIEYSFLGNTYLQCHARDNGVDDPTNSGGAVGACRYGGGHYYVVAGQQAAASTAAPGTDSAVWRPFAGHIHTPEWQPGMSWALGSPYATNPANVNGRNVFLGCYAESAQPPVQATTPSLFVGGLLDEVGVVGTATWLRGTGAGGIAARDFRSLAVNDQGIQTTFGDPLGLVIEEHQRGATSIKRVFNPSWSGAPAVETMLNHSQVLQAMTVGEGNVYGRGASVIGRLFAGSAAHGVHNARQISFVNSLADLDGQAVMAGSRFYFLNPADLGREGVVCTRGGTAGADAVLVDFGWIGTMPSGGSGGGGALGPELLSNGDFSSATGWTINGPGPAITGGQARTGTVVAEGMFQEFVAEPGATYRVEWTTAVMGNTSAAVAVGYVGNYNANGMWGVGLPGGHAFNFVATQGAMQVQLLNLGNGTAESVIDNLSIRKLA